MYLTRQQLADLIDCNPSSYKCMCRWLDRNGWPYAVSLTGMPKVSREYHDSRMGGAAPTAAAEVEPDFDALIRKV